MLLRSWGFAVLAVLACASSASAQPMAPLYDECRLDSIYPIGGQRGSTVKLEFKGMESGLTFPTGIVIDGAPGVTVKEIKPIDGRKMEATLEIAANAPLGRRWIRVQTERAGLTNFASFVVGSLPERLEVEPNSTTAMAEVTQLPLVMNGRVNPGADLDYYRFTGKKGQKLVAALAAHALDIHGQYKSFGIADFSLELLDAEGRTLAAAEDTVGYDPLIEHELPHDGDYFVRVQLLNYQGFPEACYRLTLGEVPYVTGVFPAGFRRGTPTEVELFGLNVPPGTKRLMGQVPVAESGIALDKLAASGLPAWLGEQGANWDPAYNLRHVTLENDVSSGLDVPLVVGDLPEALEVEPNEERPQSSQLAIPSTLNARFQKAGDVDWYRVRLEDKQKVQIEIVAQRFLRSPIDTLLQVYDEKGQMLLENDDESFDPGYEAYHDFKTTDSKLVFTAPAAGEYFVRVTDQTGVYGPRAVYRLTIDLDRPDFRVTHFPDTVPVWGPGSTSCVLTRIDRFSGCNDDIEVSVEGLPPGWTSKSTVSQSPTPDRPYNTYQLKVFSTVTAPANAVPGTSFPFRIVGRAKRADGTYLEHTSQPLNLFYTSDTGFFRVSPVSRVAVAKPQGPWLESVTKEIEIPRAGTGKLFIKVHGAAADLKQMPVIVNLAMAGVACGLTTPRNLPIVDGQVEVPLTLGPELPPGVYGITVAQTWRSDIRTGMPGPCTELIKLTVVPAK
ncbi:MAG: putative serine proteinase, subtilase family [Planctomycetaceae bacterium]|nr:putative serine proteinase, subtilase family [Planctomycetaceae bacterium]